ncbi:hypothetical protein [Rhabdochromatium marinum]|uniref:hypothetical protein n=1 Tax=Rhabdochromatium marinum TaxID=48729 RepID=UPI001907BDF7|nr:hypothetical protein [Rhabdochromatium marinum]
MASNKQVSMSEILKELGVTGNSTDGIYHFDVGDKFFVGYGCETSITPPNSDKPITQPSDLINISICCVK